MAASMVACGYDAEGVREMAGDGGTVPASDGGTVSANDGATDADRDAALDAADPENESIDAAGISAEGEVVELQFWYYFADAIDTRTLSRTIAAFNEEYADSIHVTATYMSREELVNQYAVGAVSGDLPDVGQIDSPDMPSCIALGVFEDITDELQAWGELERYHETSLLSCMDADGRIYGLPHNSNCLALAVNRDLLHAAGIEEAPTNAEAFAEAVARTTNRQTQTYGFALSAGSTEEGTFQILPWLCGTRNGERTSIADLTADSAVAGLQMLGDFVAQGYMSKEITNWAQADAYDQFVTGKAALCEIGSWHLANMQEDIGDAFDYQVVLLPTGDEGTSTSPLGGENIGVCTGTPHKEEALLFTEYMCSAQVQNEWVTEAGRLPTRDDVTPAYTNNQEEFAVFWEEMNYAVPRGPHAEWPTISKAIYTAAQNVFVNGIPAADALAAANEVITPILEVSPLPEP